MAESKIAVLGAVAANGGIAVAKYAAAAFTGSSAMLSEAFHSTIDMGDGLLLLFGQHRAKRPPDKAHPFGHGRELYFWAFVVAVMIFGVGGGLSIYEGVDHVIRPREVTEGIWNFVVLGIAFVFEGISWVISFRTLRKRWKETPMTEVIRETKDPTVIAVLLEDSAALLGILVAFGGVSLSMALHSPIPDGVASVIIGLILCGTALVLAREAKGLLVGEAASRHTQERIREVLDNEQDVAKVGGMLTMQLGPNEILVNAQVHFKEELEGDDLRAAVHRLSRQLREVDQSIRYVFLSFEDDGAARV